MKAEFINTLMQLTRCPRNQSQSNISCCSNCKYKFLGNGGCSEQLEAEATLFLDKFIDSLENSKSEKDMPLEWKTARIFKTLGIPTSILGYKYLKYAVELVSKDSNLLEAVTRSLYPEIARHFHSTPSKVERAIRHAIDTAWLRGDLDAHSLVFGSSISATKGKPTNSEFIGGIAEYLRLEDLV